MGLFGFGKKNKYVDEPDNNLGDTEQKEAFFLNPDEAETLGNVEYMRKKNIIRRTFPKLKGASKGAELISEVSATEQKISKGNETSMSKPADNKASTSETSANTDSQRRRADSSMDMFRNMAKDIKK